MTLTTIALLLSLPFLLSGATARPPDWQAKFRKAHRYALRYHHQRDRVQTKLTTRVLELRRLQRRVLAGTIVTPVIAIKVVFGPYADQAIRVSSCETGGTFDVNARNGQYLGLFQMGDYARSRYGHDYTALGQARYAFAYFLASGRDWSPWECKP